MAASSFKCIRCSRRYFKSIKINLFAKNAAYQTSAINRKNKTPSNVSSSLNFPETIFSGIQPTGGLHLGNYFGAVKRWVDYQNTGKKTIYSIVDLHSMTVFQDPSVLRNNIHEIASSLLACGIDPEKSIFFIQSQEKSSKVKEIPLGLLAYPVLQSADVLLYKATHVPVGEDQLQHLQITRHLARIFNKQCGNIFPEPVPLIANDASARLRSLRNPEKKMSKSEDNPLGRINLIDSPDVVLEKLKKAVTDCTSAVTFDPQLRPGVSNLITIHSLVTGKDVDRICDEVRDFDTGQYKKIVAEALITYTKPIRQRMLEYSKNPDYVANVLKRGAEKATDVAAKTWDDVKSVTGLGYSATLLKGDDSRERLVQ